VTSTGRYPHDVLASGWQHAGRPTSTDLVVEVGLVLKDATLGFCGAVLRWERGLVVLEDRHRKQRTFALGAGFWYEGSPVVLKAPPRAGSVPTRTASGSVVGPTGRAKTALASRIHVEGRHDAELVEKIWGDDLRHVGVVVEYLGGIDDLPMLLHPPANLVVIGRCSTEAIAPPVPGCSRTNSRARHPSWSLIEIAREERR
jgi:Protein of unknown function (DUF3097)